MKEELQKILFDKYPAMFRDKDKSMSESCMYWGGFDYLLWRCFGFAHPPIALLLWRFFRLIGLGRFILNRHPARWWGCPFVAPTNDALYFGKTCVWEFFNQGLLNRRCG